MNRKLIILVIIMALILTGCGEGDVSSNQVGQETSSETDAVIDAETTQETTTEESSTDVKGEADGQLYEGTVDTTSLYLVVDYSYTDPGNDKAGKIYVTLPTGFSGKPSGYYKDGKLVEDGDYPFTGSFITTEANKDVEIDIESCFKFYDEEPIVYITAYGQEIVGVDPKLRELVFNEETDSDEMCGINWFIRGYDTEIYQITINAPCDWMEGNRMLLEQLVQSIVILDQNNKPIQRIDD